MRGFGLACAARTSASSRSCATMRPSGGQAFGGRGRTRLLCILLTVLFLARQHIALRKLPFVAKLVHSFGSTTFTLSARKLNLQPGPWVAPQWGRKRSGKGERGAAQLHIRSVARTQSFQSFQ